ncbi:sugar ABC transporter ATP-binding protein [Oceanirhabdus seepicola]|uniref:Sugar ABC transporter ATP-binding protein n=1 Tax=Oceanirhabdus seepicola TaxID=2828781 RepID=A0A9J6NW58_9CLOT|nr:sugar ABC transporter ATP-binding protein [Oceanirhabdus seepicola]MCM1988727.1 sugar ABC transporter ATP-binding protein [Oceanirhabdus seepicola]
MIKNESHLVLEMKNIVKSFPGVKALKGVDLRAYSGEVMALLGENGAGKSTLMKILSGVYKRDMGVILIDGYNVEFKNIKDAQSNGVSIIHQELSVLPNLTVWENIFLGNEKYNPLTRRLNKKEMIDETRELLKEIGSDIDPEIEVRYLSVGERQMVEIVKSISKNAKLLILDEPTTALTDVEVSKLFEVIDRLKSQNIAMIYISHRLEEIFTMCDKVTVLRDGSYVGEDNVSNIDRNKLISMMVGRNLEEQYPYVEPQVGKEILRVDNISLTNRVENVSLKVNAGEIVGMSGLMGSGRTEVAKIIFGEYKKNSGNVYIDNTLVNISSPEQALNKGIAYLSEDRKGESLILNMSVKQNMTLSNLNKYENNLTKKLDRKLESEDYDIFSKKLSVKTPSGEQLIKNLSGGNQQKVILAKLIMLSPKVLIIDEPTRGIDVGAKKEIYEILNELKKAGTAIIMISSDLEEVLGISDRILVMSEGKITGEVKREDATQELIMKYAVNADH